MNKNQIKHIDRYLSRFNLYVDLYKDQEFKEEGWKIVIRSGESKDNENNEYGIAYFYDDDMSSSYFIRCMVCFGNEKPELNAAYGRLWKLMEGRRIYADCYKKGKLDLSGIEYIRCDVPECIEKLMITDDLMGEN